MTERRRHHPRRALHRIPCREHSSASTDNAHEFTRSDRNKPKAPVPPGTGALAASEPLTYWARSIVRPYSAAGVGDAPYWKYTMEM